MIHYMVLLFCSVYVISAEPCATPDSKEGNCIDLEDCKKLADLVSKAEINVDEQKFLLRSQCVGTLRVCCQISNKTVEYKPPTKPERPISLDFRGDDEDLLPKECGDQTTTDDRIIGVLASIDEYPWMSLLKYVTEKATGYACGGALISQKYVLTAAHCIVGVLGKPTEVRLGEYDTNTVKDCDFSFDDKGTCSDLPQDIGIESIVVHPDYDKGSLEKLHDIALIRLKDPAQYTDFVLPICLPDLILQRTLIKPRTILEVAGWGKTKNRLTSNIKRKARVPVVDRDSCSKNKRFAISEYQICAGGEREDSCTGDSGGPLMARRINGTDLRWYVSGIVSIGPKECARPGHAGIYTNVAHYVNWIKENIKP